MMIGPAPMISTLSMSVRLGIRLRHLPGKNYFHALRATSHGVAKARPRQCSGAARRAISAHESAAPGRLELRLQPAQHQVIEPFKQRLQVVRTRARLGMTLEAEGRLVLQSDSLQRAVEQRAVSG